MEVVPVHNKEDGTRWLFKVPFKPKQYVILMLLQDCICMQLCVDPTFCRVFGLHILRVWRPESTPVIHKSTSSWNMELHLTLVLPDKIISWSQTVSLTLAIKLFVIFIGHGYLNEYCIFFSHLHIPFPSVTNKIWTH